MKELLDTAFQYEIGQVFNSGTVGPNYTYTVSVIANGMEIVASKVLGRHKLRDYINNYTDLSSITLLFVNSELEFKIKPYHDNLEVVIVRGYASVNPTMVSQNILKMSETFRFRGILTNESRDLLSQNNPFIKDRDVQERSLSKPITIQLIDKTVDVLRTMEVNTNFRNTSGIKAIETLLTAKSKEASNLAKSAVLGIDIADNYNTDIRSSITTGTVKLTSLPKVIAENCGGIYPAGFSYYLQNRIWYLYPPYDIQRFKKVQRNLTIVNLPKNRLAGIEKTYRNSNTQLIILSTGDVSHVSHSSQNQLNYGNGARFLDADRLDEMGVMDNNRYRIDVTKNFNEVETYERSDGMSIAFKGNNYITSNKYGELSQLAARMGSFIQLTWSNSQDELIYPGMPVKFLYLDNNKPTEAYGVVSAVETYETPANINFAQTKFTSETAVTVFIQQPTRA